MAADDTPIIIKKIKKGGHGHHGGAWKVAYADFVTAMMAFFLLMWLLSVTSPEQKMGLAEYFTPTTGIKDSMGIGFKGGKKPTTDIGRSNTDLTAPGLVSGQVKQGPLAGAPTPEPVKPKDEATNSGSDQRAETDNAAGAADTTDSDAFKQADSDVKQSIESDPDMKDYKNDIVVQESQEGMKIEMIDDEKKPMFVPGGAALTDMGKKVLDSMANIIIKTPNNISITGHTDAAGPAANPQYTSWELSTDRANAARRFLVTTQLEPDRVLKVVGMADKELLVPQEPKSPRNRRVTIVLLRGSYFRDPKAMPTTRGILSVPDAKVKKDEPKKDDSAPADDSKTSLKPNDSIFDPATKAAPDSR